MAGFSCGIDATTGPVVASAARREGDMAHSIMYAFWTVAHARNAGAHRNDLNRLLLQLNQNAAELSVERLIEVAESSRLLVACDHAGKNAGFGRAVGMATLVSVVKPSRFEGRVEDVVVDEEYSGQGIGKCMMEMLVQEARLLGLLRLELTSNPSRKAANVLYQALGFERYETNVYRLTL